MKNQNLIKVNKDIIEKSERCNQDFSCKSENWKSCSKIDENINDIILHLGQQSDESKMMFCNYHLPFGGDNYCTCPARLYIYQKYNV